MNTILAKQLTRRDGLVLQVSVLVLASVSGMVRGRPGAGRGDHGATATEYALMGALIAVVVVAAVTVFGRNVSGLFKVPAGVLTP